MESGHDGVVEHESKLQTVGEKMSHFQSRLSNVSRLLSFVSTA